MVQGSAISCSNEWGFTRKKLRLFVTAVNDSQLWEWQTEKWFLTCKNQWLNRKRGFKKVSQKIVTQSNYVPNNTSFGSIRNCILIRYNACLPKRSSVWYLQKFNRMVIETRKVFLAVEVVSFEWEGLTSWISVEFDLNKGNFDKEPTLQSAINSISESN